MTKKKKKNLTHTARYTLVARTALQMKRFGKHGGSGKRGGGGGSGQRNRGASRRSRQPTVENTSGRAQERAIKTARLRARLAESGMSSGAVNHAVTNNICAEFLGGNCMRGNECAFEHARLFDKT